MVTKGHELINKQRDGDLHDDNTPTFLKVEFSQTMI